MTKAEARRRRRRRQIAAWAVVLLAEVLAVAAQTAVVAVPLVLFAKAQRGYSAFGAEWIIILAVFCGGHFIVHNRVCDKIFEEGKHR